MRVCVDNGCIEVAPARIGKVLLLVVLLAFGATPAFPQIYPSPYPRPNATKVIDNERINAWDVYWIKDRPTPLHTHVLDQLSVTLRGGLLRVSPAGGPWGDAHMSQIGSVTFVPIGTIHMEEGLSDVPQHKVMLELKPSPAHPEMHGSVPAEGAVKVFENSRLIAWDTTWLQGKNIARPESDLDSVEVFLDGGTLSATHEGQTVNVARKSGDVIYIPHGARANIENALAGSPRAIIVQLK